MTDRSWLKVQPDKQYLIAEERLRFSLPADIPPDRVPYAVMLSGELPAAMEIFEKHRGWRPLTTVPKRKQFPGGKPCCAEIMSRKVGETLTIKFMPSDYQGDTDDAHNFGELSNPGKRLEEDNLVDWVAIIHFWVPAITVDNQAEADYRNSLGLAQGFAPLELLPGTVASYLQERFKNG